MKKSRILLLAAMTVVSVQLQAKDYNASLFGAKSNGTTSTRIPSSGALTTSVRMVAAAWYFTWAGT